MKQLSNRGAARIGAVWMIVVIVLFFVALAYAYVSNQAAQVERDASAAARVAQADAVEEADAAKENLLSLSKPVGFYDESTAGSTSDLTGVADAIQSLKDAYALGDTVTTFEDTINPMIAQLSQRDSAMQTLAARITTLEGEKSSIESTARSTQQELQKQISKLTSEKSDEAQLLNDRIDALQGQVDERTAERNSLDDDLNQKMADNDDLAVRIQDERVQSTILAKGLQNQVKEFKGRAETADGKFVSTSKDLGIGWIDRGAKHRVAAGMIFDVMTGHPNPSGPAIKAQCEILRVSERTSEVRVFNVADPYDPVVADDVIYNPIYDPEGDRYAVLAGRFGGAYNESEIALMLEEVGITVQKSLDLTTNYLVVGQPMYLDEDGEMLEVPRQPSDLAVYKNAQAQGCSIISINDFRAYFKR